MGGHLPSNRAIEEIEIADQIENFMPDKFIRESKFGVDDLLIVNQDEDCEAVLPLPIPSVRASRYP